MGFIPKRASNEILFEALSMVMSGGIYVPPMVLRSQLRSAAGRRDDHGWGVAVDLCGGIQSFGTAEHTWLFTHAPLFGWFHPAWAEPTGSRPEPWHWEFAH